MSVTVTVEILVHCDYPSCNMEETIFSGEPSGEPPDPIPPGWGHRSGKQYCPGHWHG